MSGQRPTRSWDELAHAWRGLAERRHEHFVELYNTGRWTRYYTEERFLAQMNDALQAVEIWTEIAPPAALNPMDAVELSDG